MTLILIGNILCSIGLAGEIVHIIARILRRRSVKGSRQRYIFASIENIAIWIFLLDVMGSVFLGKTLSVIIIGICWIVLYSLWRNDHDDDDFWSNMKKKIKRAVKSMVTGLSLKPSYSYN